MVCVNKVAVKNKKGWGTGSSQRGWTCNTVSKQWGGKMTTSQMWSYVHKGQRKWTVLGTALEALACVIMLNSQGDSEAKLFSFYNYRICGWERGQGLCRSPMSPWKNQLGSHMPDVRQSSHCAQLWQAGSGRVMLVLLGKDGWGRESGGLGEKEDWTGDGR